MTAECLRLCVISAVSSGIVATVVCFAWRRR